VIGSRFWSGGPASDPRERGPNQHRLTGWKRAGDPSARNCL